MKKTIDYLQKNLWALAEKLNIAIEAEVTKKDDRDQQKEHSLLLTLWYVFYVTEKLDLVKDDIKDCEDSPIPARELSLRFYGSLTNPVNITRLPQPILDGIEKYFGGHEADISSQDDYVRSVFENAKGIAIVDTYNELIHNILTHEHEANNLRSGGSSPRER